MSNADMFIVYDFMYMFSNQAECAIIINANLFQKFDSFQLFVFREIKYKYSYVHYVIIYIYIYTQRYILSKQWTHKTVISTKKLNNLTTKIFYRL